MALLAQGRKATLELRPGQTYRVITGGVAIMTAVYGAPAGTTTVTASSQDFGPYSAPAKLELSAVSQAADYSLLQKNPATVDAGTNSLDTPDGSAAVALARTLSTLELATAIPGQSRDVVDLAGGTILRSNGARFRTDGCHEVNFAVDDVVAFTGTTNVRLGRQRFPAKILGLKDTLGARFTLMDTGTVEIFTGAFYFGPNGDDTDTKIFESVFFFSTAAQRSSGAYLEFRFETLTSIQKMGNASAGNSFGGGSTDALPAVVAIPSFASADMYLSFYGKMNASSETTTSLGGRFFWVPSSNG